MLDDKHLRPVLERSDEFARYDEAEAETSEGDVGLYPPLSSRAERLRKLADSAERLERRIEERRRAEEARYDQPED